MKIKRSLSLRRAASLGAALLTIGLFASKGFGSFSSSDFLKTNGILIKNNSGTGTTVDLHGTNIGGWLTQENWMSPQGEFALDRTGWTTTASVNATTAGNAIDGAGTSNWNTGTAQTNGQYFQVNLGRRQTFNEVDLDTGTSTTDFPASYQVLVSNDGATWTDVASALGSQPITAILFAPQVAQYIKVVQTGSSSHWWTIAEFNVYSTPMLDRTGWTASASSTGSGSSVNNALDGNQGTRWTSGITQATGQWFEVDMGSTQSVGTILFDAGPSSATDYPRGYQLQVSTDNTNWTTVSPGYFGNTRTIALALPSSQNVRYFRIIQTGTSSSWWSIAELVVYSPGNFNRSGWVATASSTDTSGDVPANALDSSTSTRWSSGVAQANGQWFQVDMGSNQTFNQIQLDSGSSSSGDYPRGYTVQVSNDASSWTQVASGSGFNEMLAINFPAVSARYFKITQTGSSTSWWSIANLDVYLNIDENDQRATLYNRFGTTTASSLVNGFENSSFTTADLDNIKNMGMNFVRVPIHYLELANPDGTWRSDAWTRLDWIVNQCNSRNIYALLDFHVPQGGVNPWASGGQIGPLPPMFWQNTAYQDLVVTLWQGIATHYNGNAAVAGYEILNEGIVAYSESAAQHKMKNDFYDRVYKAIRAIDADHTIYLDAFFDYSFVEPPGTYGWTNVVYELHPYDFGDALNWDGQNTTINNTVSALIAKQNDSSWGAPIYMGEYCFYYFTDIWQKWMSSLNALHVSWTNWTYKVRGLQTDSGGGSWGFYNTNTYSVPVLNSDTSSTISSKWANFATSNYTANTSLINTVTPFASGQSWMATVPLDQTGWTASASSTGSGDSPANALDWNLTTRWSTGAVQTNGQWFQVNMGSKKVFDQISLETEAAGTWNYPNAYQIQVSNDGSTWTTVASGAGFGHKMLVQFAVQYAQYIRVVQTGSDSAQWWSIAEFHAYSEMALARTGWAASASSTDTLGDVVGNAIDGNLSTRWSSGVAQANGQWFQVDMGKNQTFNRVLLDAASNTNDYPRGYQVQVSTDGTTWSTVASGTGSGPAVLVQFAPQVARYLKIVQTGTSTSWWSIAELNVYGEWEYGRTGWTASASVTDSLGDVAANAIDGNFSTRWSSGVAQANGQWFQVDLGSSQWFNHIVMDSGSASSGDYARKYIVQVSNDATNWTEIATGEGTGQVVTVNFPIVQDRYIKVIQTGSSGSWWSIAEFRVFQ